MRAAPAWAGTARCCHRAHVLAWRLGYAEVLFKDLVYPKKSPTKGGAF